MHMEQGVWWTGVYPSIAGICHTYCVCHTQTSTLWTTQVRVRHYKIIRSEKFWLLPLFNKSAYSFIELTFWWRLCSYMTCTISEFFSSHHLGTPLGHPPPQVLRDPEFGAVPEISISNHFAGYACPAGPRLAFWQLQIATKCQKKTRRFSLLKKDKENPGQLDRAILKDKIVTDTGDWYFLDHSNPVFLKWVYLFERDGDSK